MEAYVYLGKGKQLLIQTGQDGTRFIVLKNPDTEQRESWLCVSDLAKKFDYKAFRQVVLRHVNAEDTKTLLADTSRGQHPLKFISPRGFARACAQLKGRLIQAEPETSSNQISSVIRTVTDPCGTVWLNAADACRELGYSNSRLAVKRHVRSEDVCLLYFNTGKLGRRLSVGITERGYQDLRNARLNANNHIQAICLAEELTAPATEATKKHPSTQIKRAKSSLWLPPFAGDIKPSKKCRGDRVIINFSYGSNWLLKGTKGYISAQEFGDSGEPVSTQGIFNRFGYLVHYPEEWKQAFENTESVKRVPAKHQLVLDLLMSDYIGSVRKDNQQEDSDYFHVPEDRWITHDIFEFRLVEWFTAFHTDLNSTRPEQRVRFKRWSERALNGLCYLMRAGIIQPVCPARTPEAEQELQDILQETTNYYGLDPDPAPAPEAKDVYTGETTDAYAYCFRFAPCWIQEIASESLPMPVYILPSLGRVAHGGSNFWYKYTCNRLLYAEMNQPKRKAKVKHEGRYHITLKKYCLLTGVPLLSEWSTQSNLDYNSMKRSRYENGLIRNVLETFGLFKVFEICWKASLEDRYNLTPSDKAVITLKPMYQK